MRNLFIAIKVLITIFLLIAVPYSLIKYVISPNWRFVLFYTYVFGGVIFVFFGFKKTVQLRKDMRKSLNQFTLLALCSEVTQKTSLIKKMRQKITSYLEFVHQTILWPTVLPLTFYKTTIGVKYLNELSKMHPESDLKSYYNSPNAFFQFMFRTQYGNITEVFDPLVLLTNITVVYLINYFYSPPWEFTFTFLALMLTHVMARHLSYVIKTVDLVASLKMREGNPYLRYLTIVFLDFSSIVLAFAIITAVKNDTFLTFGLLKDIASGLLFFKRIGNLIHIKNMPIFDIWVGAVGIIFYFTLLRIILRLQNFKRSINDFRAIAEKHMLMGEFNKALEILDEIEKKKKLEIEDLRKKVMCFLCLNKTDSSFDTARNYLNVTKGKNVSNDDIFSFVAESITLLDISDDHFIIALRKGIELQVTDTRLYSAINVSISKFGAKGGKEAYINRLKVLFEDQATKDNYPLSFSWILIEQNETLKVVELLNSYYPEKVLDQINCSALRIFSIIELDEFLQYHGLSRSLSEFYSPVIIETNIKKILFAIDRLSNNWELVFSIFILYSMLMVIEHKFPSYKKQWLQAIKKLKASIAGDDEMKAKVKLIENVIKYKLHELPIES